MKTITLTILKEDILLDNYMTSKECPITKALHRAGYLKLKDVGYITGLDNNGEYIDLGKKNDTYSALLIKLFGMYNSLEDKYDLTLNGEKFIPPSIPIETFIHTLNY